MAYLLFSVLYIVEQNGLLFDIAWYFAVLGQLAG